MPQPLTSLTLIAMTVASTVAAGFAIRGLRHRHSPAATTGVTGTLIALIILSLALLGGRWVQSGQLSQPLHAHVDGLVLINTLLAAALLFLRWQPRMLAVSAFGLPILALLYAWSVCAVTWTYRPFRIDSLTPLWTGLHLAGVYIGTLCFVIGAVAAAAYLYVHHRIRHKDEPETIGRLPPLETLEQLVIRSATAGFAILTIGLIGGIVVISRQPAALSPGGWIIAKLTLAGGAWLLYALLINLRFATSFRGPRAAWLSIAGLVLIIATYALVSALPSAAPAAPADPPPVTAPAAVTIEEHA